MGLGVRTMSAAGGAIGRGHGVLPEEHGDFFLWEAFGVPEARDLEEGIGLFPEGDIFAGVGVIGEVEVAMEIGLVVGVEAVADDAVLVGGDAGGEGGLGGRGDGGEGGLICGAVKEGGERGEMAGAFEEGLVEAGDEDEADAGHGGSLMQRCIVAGEGMAGFNERLANDARSKGRVCCEGTRLSRRK